MNEKNDGSNGSAQAGPVAGYWRVSSGNQGAGDVSDSASTSQDMEGESTLVEQRDAVRRFAEESGIRVVGEYADVGEPGFSGDSGAVDGL